MDNRTAARRTRKLRWRLEDAVPALGVPGAHYALMAVRRSYRANWRKERDLAVRIAPDRTVQAGPFAGMRYTSDAAASPFLPKLAGTYELEVADALEAFIAAEPDLVIDVGSAEGYYAVGLARRLPAATHVAFDVRRSARWLTRRMAAANGVAVELRGAASQAALGDLCRGAARPLVVCDIDGGESTLLDPVLVPDLARALLLVETHESYVPGVTEDLVTRFSPTHAVRRYPVVPRPADLLPRLRPLDADAAMDERRPHQSWLAATPRHPA